jgi:hypothetical protein
MINSLANNHRLTVVATSNKFLEEVSAGIVHGEPVSHGRAHKRTDVGANVDAHLVDKRCLADGKSHLLREPVQLLRAQPLLQPWQPA